ncbi:hypothetical protein F5888DRAFT_1890115 [Russula emetica]|nr:hypothetical protein F5888DRAFT_1890115 [Russula emetica]
MSANENTPSPSKRQRPEKREIEREGGRSSLLSCLELIPLEILAEVLSYVNSPKDVLSVARCSKHLCATLLNPSNVMIWRRARHHCVVPDLPPPLPGWSESAYAAFVFDEGHCYVCHVTTKRMFWSFVARVRICGQHECRKKLFDKHVRVQNYGRSDSESRFFQKRLRYLEVPIVHIPGATHHYCLRTDVKKTTLEYEKMIRGNVSQDDYLCRLETNILRQKQILEHAKMLYQWSQQWSHKYRMTKTSNTDFARKLATDAGWNVEDLLNTSTYSSLHRSYTTCLETISEGDVRLLLTKIDTEIFAQVEKKDRRQKAHAQQMRRTDITRHYDRIVEEKNYPVIPILAEFRELPIIKALHDRDDAMPIPSNTTNSSSANIRVLESELKRSELISGMIDSDLKNWVQTALAAFDSMLGQPKWKSASTRVLHPAERVTARFICAVCSSPPKTCTTSAESLDFREACAHECVRHSRKAVAKRKWRADQFVPDQKAIDILSLALSLLGLKEENRETKAKIELIGARFLCKSCDSPIVMTFQRLAGHCRRHDKMQVELISMADATLGAKHPYVTGSSAKYTARTNKAKKLRQMKVFGCRHCQCRDSEPVITLPARNNDHLWGKRFTFNGLVSHAKEKHKIFSLGDEDFFRDPLTAKIRVVFLPSKLPLQYEHRDVRVIILESISGKQFTLREAKANADPVPLKTLRTSSAKGLVILRIFSINPFVAR